eukprot:9476860-Pyramimonas_sp.AAC.2
MPIVAHRAQSRDSTVSARRDCAVSSRVAAQSAGLATFVRSSSFVFSINIFDDCNSFICKPKSVTGICDGPVNQRAAASIAKKFSRRGKNICMPTFNTCEHIFIHRRAQPGDAVALAGAEVHSPAVVLPLANAGTIMSRLSRWSVNLACGAGTSIGGGSLELRRAIVEAPWRTIIFCRGNLVTNNCVIRMEEKAVQTVNATAPDDDHHVTLLDVRCASHSGVLCQRPFLDSIDKLPSTIVRLGHVLESGRAAHTYSECIKDFESFIFVSEVRRVPARI